MPVPANSDPEPASGLRDDVTPPAGYCLVPDVGWKRERHFWLEGLRRDQVLNPSAKVVAHAMVLGRLGNEHVARCFATMGEIAFEAGTSHDTVKRAIRDLIKHGWIVKNSGKGRGKSSTYGYVSRARIVPLKGGTDAPSKGGAGAPFSGSKKGADLPQGWGTGAPFSPYNRDNPDLSQNMRAGTDREMRPSKNPQVIADAEGAVSRFRGGRHDALSDLKPWVLTHIIAANLLTPEERQAAGLAEKGTKP